jgi:outer membrane protein OmpA-like peptidoglycan-associated protein
MNRVIILPALLAATALSACSHDYPSYPDGKGAQYSEAPYTVTRHATNTEYAVPNQLLFATDSADVLPAGHKILAEIADVAKKHETGAIEVDGFTDTTGPKRHNDKLSIARAQAVAGELAQNGVAAGRIAARGFGERELAVPTGDQVDEAKNRRVVVRIASS